MGKVGSEVRDALSLDAVRYPSGDSAYVVGYGS